MFSRRRRIARLAASAAKLRHLLAVAPVYSVASTACATERAGLRAVGTLRGNRSDGVTESLQCFLDPSGTTVVGTADGLVLLFSVTDTDDYITFVRRRIPLGATPPFQHFDFVEADTDAEALEAHRTRIRDVIGVKVFASIEEIAEPMTRHFARRCAWRNAQDDRELLDLDLRAVLGRTYDRIGSQVAERLVQTVPKATVVR